MEALTGIMIAGFILFSENNLLEIGSTIFFLLAAMMLAYQPIRSLATINMVAYQGAAPSKEYNIIDKQIEILDDKNLQT